MATVTTGAGEDAMAGRIQLANTAATLCLVLVLVLQLACLVNLPHADARDYLWGRIDIPLEVQSIWPAGGGMGYHAHGIAALSPDWPPCLAVLNGNLWAAALAIYAAVRRNWTLFFAMQILLAVPGEWFGTHDHEVGPASTLISAGIVVIHGLVRRRFRLAMAAVAAAAAVLGVHAATDGHAAPPERSSNQVFDEAGNGWSTDTDAVDRITAAMAAATPAQRPAADYVLAQMAYLRHDWPAAKALAPRLRPDLFSHGPYTGKRVFVLQALAAGRTALAPPWVFAALDIAFGAAFLVTLAVAIFGWRLRRRAKRIDTLHHKLGALRSARAAAA